MSRTEGEPQPQQPQEERPEGRRRMSRHMLEQVMGSPFGATPTNAQLTSRLNRREFPFQEDPTASIAEEHQSKINRPENPQAPQDSRK